MEGISLSSTVTVKLQELVEPPASKTRYVTVVTPLLKLNGVVILLIPLSGDEAMVAPLMVQVSVMISPSVSFTVAASPLLEALQTPGSVLVVILPGQTMVGGAARAFKGMKFRCIFFSIKLLSEY